LESLKSIHEAELQRHEEELMRRVSELERQAHTAAAAAAAAGMTSEGGGEKEDKGLHARRESWHHARTGHMADRDEHEVRKQPRITLLYWTKFFGEDNVFVNEDIVCGQGEGAFTVSLSHDRTKLSKAAGVIFHARGDAI